MSLARESALRTAVPSLSVASPRRGMTAILANSVLVIIGLCFLLPLSWLVLGSFDTHATYQTAVPEQFSLDNFAAVLKPELTFIPLWNSFLLSVGSAVVTVVAALLAAYPLSRYQARSIGLSCMRFCSGPACRSPPSWSRFTASSFN